MPGINKAHQVGCPLLRSNSGNCKCPKTKKISKSQERRLRIQRQTELDKWRIP